MTMQLENLCCLGYANGFTLWHYKTDDFASAVAAEGYFDDAHKVLHVGDMIFINAQEVAMHVSKPGHEHASISFSDLLAVVRDVTLPRQGLPALVTIAVMAKA